MQLGRGRPAQSATLDRVDRSSARSARRRCRRLGCPIERQPQPGGGAAGASAPSAERRVAATTRGVPELVKILKSISVEEGRLVTASVLLYRCGLIILPSTRRYSLLTEIGDLVGAEVLTVFLAGRKPLENGRKFSNLPFPTFILCLAISL